MKQIEGILRTLSPVHIGNGRSQGTFLPTLNYIPGRTIRGMLGYYLFKNDPDLARRTGIDEMLDRNKMKILFRNAYPLSENRDTVSSPLSLKWCKLCNSLMGDDDFFCRNMVEGPCLHEGKKRAGLISTESFSSGRFTGSMEVKKTISTKCPIIRGTHTSPGSEEDGFELSPYHIEAIAEEQKFRFKILIWDDDCVDDIINALDDASLFNGIGGFRSRGYGNVQFDRVEIKDFGTIAQTRTQQLEPFRGQPATLVMDAPMILKNNGKSVVGFDDVFLKEAKTCLGLLNIKSNISLDPMGKSTLGRDNARGWSLITNRADEIIPCIGAGSTVSVIAEEPRALAALEIFGIGDLTHCGYGQVYCLPELNLQNEVVI